MNENISLDDILQNDDLTIDYGNIDELVDETSSSNMDKIMSDEELQDLMDNIEDYE